MAEKIIALFDCDCFFVSCEQAENPKLRGRPVCVVTGDNGCVVSRSPEAKKMGVKMGMPMFMARQQFPKASYLCGRHGLYRRYSERVMATLRSLAPDVEVVSVDEAYADLTSLSAVYHKSYPELAAWIRQTIWQQNQIPVSVGLASSKLLAKLASDKAKETGGVFAIFADSREEVLRRTAISEVCGIGRSHLNLLSYNGVVTAWDFVCRPDSWIRREMGLVGLEIKYELQGQYWRKLKTEPSLPQSVQDTSVLPEFTADFELIKSQLHYHLHRACHRMRQQDCLCRAAGIMLRAKNFAVFSEKVKLSAAFDGEKEIAAAIMPLLPKIYRFGMLYRSSGVMLYDLVSRHNYQPELFAAGQSGKSNRLSAAWDSLEDKFGPNVIKVGWR